MVAKQENGNPLRVVLTGNPNTGKSVLFGRLTGAYVTVSNYPGTTVEVTYGRGSIQGIETEFCDTPGLYSLFPVSEEEEVARQILVYEPADLVLHIIDAKNLPRMLPLTLQLIAAGLPVILVLNLMDEAERAGIEIDMCGLEEKLGIPVIPTVAVTGRGLEELREEIASSVQGGRRLGDCDLLWGEDRDPLLFSAVDGIADRMRAEYRFSPMILAWLYLAGDSEIEQLLIRKEGYRNLEHFADIRKRLAREYERPLEYVFGTSLHRVAADLAEKYMKSSRSDQVKTSLVDRLTTHPVTGMLLLTIILYLGLYRFVGVFGAGTVVDFLERAIFQELINPTVNDLAVHYLPAPWWELVAGPYGIITLGFRYAIAIILPVVGSFFLVFSLLEDSGYFPRLALLVDRLFKKIGLNGRAVIPIVLGLGCDTMATMTTRILETRRERIIATFLLALAVPCSAQLGVIMALLAPHPTAFMVWLVTVVAIFSGTGVVAGRFIFDSQPQFYMEVPPLRWPRIGNVFEKTFSRVRWYFIEILPIFIYASILLWLGRITGFFSRLIHLLSPLMRLLGLPERTAVAFLFGFFRRDYGAAGLFDMVRAGEMNTVQLTVAAVTMTLFVPCIAQLMLTIRERGFWVAMGMLAIIFPLAFGSGFVIYRVLLLFPF